MCGKLRGHAIEIKHFQDFCEALKTEDRVCRKKFNTKKETPDRASLFVHIGGLCEKRGESNETSRYFLRGHIWNRVIISGIVMMQSSMVTVLIRLA